MRRIDGQPNLCCPQGPPGVGPVEALKRCEVTHPAGSTTLLQWLLCTAITLDKELDNLLDIVEGDGLLGSRLSEIESQPRQDFGR